MKTRADLHREIAAVCDMIEGTDLELSHCFKVDGNKGYCFLNFEAVPSSYEPCLAIVEGKPVFKGDLLYYGYSGLQTFIQDKMSPEKWSWNQPKPKTVMVEVQYNVAEKYAERNPSSACYFSMAEACKKALEEK